MNSPKKSVLVHEIMTEDLHTVKPGTSLADAAKKMREADVGMLPVCEGGKLVGVVTDRDLVIRGMAEETDPAVTPVMAVMSTPVHTCSQTDDVRVAAATMKRLQIRRIMVLGPGSRLAGVLSLGDLAIDLEDEELSANVLGRVSERKIA